MPLKRSHTLYLSSKFRDKGTSSRYTISLPELIQSDPNLECFKISLQSFSTYNSWFLIKQGCNTIYVNNVPIVLPSGTFSYQRLAKVISTYIETEVKWLQDTNRLWFIFEGETNLRFDDNLAIVLGFDADTTYTGTDIVSVRSMTPLPNTHLIIHLNNISPMTEHLTFSNHTGEVRIENILAKVLINSNPFSLITYHQLLESQGIYSNDNSLGVLDILITDMSGNEMLDIPEHELTLSIESVDVEDYDTNTMIDRLDEMNKTLKDLLIYKVLKK